MTLSSVKRSDSTDLDVPNTNKATTGQLLRLIKLWHQLSKDQRDIDFRKAAWAREFRAYYPTDEKFFRGCVDELGLTRYQSEELLLQARVSGIVRDLPTWNQLGGFREIRSVVALPAKEQVHVLEIAKTTGRAVRTLVKERIPQAPPAPLTATPLKTAEVKRNNDVALLAEFIAGRRPMNGEIATLVRMYVPDWKPK